LPDFFFIRTPIKKARAGFPVAPAEFASTSRLANWRG
jgi:hypothetical protein